MPYSLHLQQQKKIPAPIAILVVGILVFGIGFFFERSDPIQKAEFIHKTSIERSEIANLRDNSVTLFWRSSDSTIGHVEYGTSESELLDRAYDIRDKTGSPKTRNNHVVTINNLQPDTTYYYNLIVGNEVYGQNETTPFVFNTTRPVTSPLDIEPIYGAISDEEGNAIPGTVVILNIDSAQPLITLTKDDGSFLFSPCCIFNNSTNEPFYPSEKQLVKLEIIEEEGITKEISTSLADVSPLSKPVVLSDDVEDIKDYELETSDEVLAEAESIQTVDSIDIIFPRKNMSIPGTKPLIKGLGEPGKKVKGRIDPEGKIFQMIVDSSRVWEFSPSFNLRPGDHTLTVTTEDDSGNEIALVREFIIQQSGQKVLGDATPSATMTPPQATPTDGTPDPTDPPVPTATSVPVPKTPTPPITGINIIPVAVVSLAFIVIGAGFILLF